MVESQKMLEFVIAFNDAGAIHVEEGSYSVAWQLFKAALEAKLAFERIKEGDDSVQEVMCEWRQNPFIVRAQCILETIKCYSKEYFCQEPKEVPKISPLCLYSKPFRLQNHCGQQLQLSSAIIIFNLALVEHITCRTAERVASLYELASSQLIWQPMNFLSIALMNNFAVWCFENDKVETSQRCVNHLIATMQSCDLSGIPRSDCTSMVSNIHLITSLPTSTTSAAA